MFRTWTIAATIVLAAMTAAAQKNKLNLFIWSEYIDPEIITAFEEKFDCKVTVDLYEDNDSMMAKLRSGGDALYDVCVPSGYIVQALISQKLIQPLRHENIPNMANLESKFIDPSFDPGNQYSVAYQWGTVGVYIRRGDQPVDETWGLIFDASKQPGSFVLIDDMRSCIGSALKYKGYSMNTTNPKELMEARDLLIEAKGRSQGFDGGVGGKNKVLARQVQLAVVYNGDAVRGIGDDSETHYFVPREGGEIWVDNLVVPAKAPNRDMAEAFINFILDAEVGAQLSNFNQYASPNRASRPFITPEDLENPAIYPDAETMARLEFQEDLGKNTKLYSELWTQIKSK